MLKLYEPGDEAAWLASFHFSIELRPRFCETDAVGHVSNVVYPTYLEAGRLQYLAAAGDPEVHELYAFRHVTAELTLRYVAAAHYDEPLRIYSKVSSLGRSSLVMEQAIAGPHHDIRTLARVIAVRNDGTLTRPWTDAQREALARFEPGLPLSNTG